MNAPELYIQSDGAGPELVLLHGWGMSSAVWDDLVPELSASYRVIRVDLPGHGHSAGVPFGDLDAVIARLRPLVSAPATWVGWSMGAARIVVSTCRNERRNGYWYC